MLRWFDLGMKGELLAHSDSDERIDRHAFGKAFNILAMHHYIFEPPGHPMSFSLHLNYRKTTLRNLATADFDMVLCGHKHVPAFCAESYASFFPDRNTRGRYLLNLFRRLIRIHTFPHQFSDRTGRKMKKQVSAWISYILLRNPRHEGETDESYLDRLLTALRAVLKDPTSWHGELREFIVEGGPCDCECMSASEAQELVSQMLS
ncbi:MAG: hypothetical protein AB1714_09885 [Acidobacteriota bacterium]